MHTTKQYWSPVECLLMSLWLTQKWGNLSAKSLSSFKHLLNVITVLKMGPTYYFLNISFFMVPKPTKLVLQKKCVILWVVKIRQDCTLYPLILTMTFSEDTYPIAISRNNLDILCNRKFPDATSELKHSFNHSTPPLSSDGLSICAYLFIFIYQAEMGRTCHKILWSKN